MAKHRCKMNTTTMATRILLLVSIFFLNSQFVLAQKSIKIIKLGHQPIVAGKLNGKKAYFLVDTGSDATFLNSKDAKKFKFKSKKMLNRKYKLAGFDSDFNGDLLVATDIEMNLGGELMRGSYKLFDISNIAQSISQSGGIRINGIIGSDLMKRYNFVIDYKAREITFPGRK